MFAYLSHLMTLRANRLGVSERKPDGAARVDGSLVAEGRGDADGRRLVRVGLESHPERRLPSWKGLWSLSITKKWLINALGSSAFA